MSKNKQDAETSLFTEEETLSTEQNDEQSTIEQPAETEATQAAEGLENAANRIKALEEEVGSLKDQYLRKQAEFDNFRKRLLRDKEDSIRYANSGLLKDLLSIIDDFERAIKSSEESKDFEALHTGVSLIEKQFVSMLEKNWGLKKIESVGQEFDPEYHEALAMTESTEHDAQIVLEDFMRGYMLHDRVLRHSKVRVASPVAADNATGGGESTAQNQNTSNDD